MTCSDEFSTFKDQVFKKKKQVQTYSRELQELLQTCTHEEKETRSEYNAGSYLDRAFTTHYVVCTVCGKPLKQETVQHDWFG